MYNNDDLFNMFNSYTTTETDEKTYQDTQGPQSDFSYEKQKSPYVDDYTTNQNFEEQRSYETFAPNDDFEQTQTAKYKQMEAPTIMQSEKTVNLIKTKEKLRISPRLKIAAATTIVILAILVFATIWNFAWAAQASADFSAKQSAISEISQSINDLKLEYNELTSTDGAYSGYVEKIDGENSFVFSLDEFYSEPEIEQFSSNWFNDVCEFFSKLFA